MILSSMLLLLKDECARAGGQKAWAEKNGMSAAHVNDVLWSRKDPGEKILNALGLVKVVTYVRKKP